MARKFTYEVHVDLSSLRGQTTQARQMLESVFAGVGKTASPFASVGKDIDQIKKSLDGLAKIDLGKSFSGFSAQINQAQADAKKLQEVLSGLSGGKGVQLPDISKFKQDLEGIAKVDLNSTFERIKTQAASLKSMPPVVLSVSLDTANIAAQAGDVRKALQAATQGLDKGVLPTGTLVAELTQVKTQLDLIGRADVSRVFIAMNSQIAQVVAGISAIDSALQSALSLRGNSLAQSVLPQIDALRSQLQSLNQVDISGSVEEMKSELGELKTVLSGISLARRFTTPPKFVERIAALKGELQSLSEISIVIPNPFKNFGTWTTEAITAIGNLRKELGTLEPTKKGRGKTATEEIPGLSTLKAELQSINTISITKPITDFRTEVDLAVAALAKLKTEGGNVNAQSSNQQSSAIGKPFQGFTDIAGPTMQLKQQLQQIGSMDVSRPFDDMSQQAQRTIAQVSQLSSDISKLQQPRGSMNLSDLSGGAGGGGGEAPKVGKVTKPTVAAVSGDVKALESQVQELKAKLEEINKIVASLNSVNVTQDTAAVQANIAAARTHLTEVGKQLTELGKFRIEADLSPLLDQVKKIGASLTKITQFAELAKISPSGDLTTVQAKITTMRQSLMNVNGVLSTLNSVQLTNDLTPLMAQLKQMRLNLGYIGRFAENLSNIGVFADFAPLNAKVELLRQNLVKITTIVNSLVGAAPGKDLSATVARISQTKDDLGAIGRAAAELSQIVLETTTVTSVTNLVTKLESIKTPLANLSKTVAELSKVKFDKDLTTLASQVQAIHVPLTTLGTAITALGGLTISGDLAGFSTKIDAAKASLLSIKNSMSELSKFKIEGDVTQLSGELQRVQTQLGTVGTTISSIAATTMTDSSSAIGGLSTKLDAYKAPLAQLSASLKEFNKTKIDEPTAGIGEKLAKIGKSLTVIAHSVGALSAIPTPEDPAGLANLVAYLNTIKAPLKSLGTLVTELSTIKVDADASGFAAQMAAIVKPMKALSQSINSLSAITFTGDISELLAKIGQAKTSLTGIGQAITDLSSLTISGELGPLRDQVERVRAPMVEIAQIIGQISGIALPADTTGVTNVATLLKGLKKPLTDLGTAVTTLSTTTVDGNLATLVGQLGKARAELTSLSTALTEFTQATQPPDAAALAAIIEKFALTRKPIQDIGKLVADLSKMTAAGDLTPLATQLNQIKAPLAEISQSLNQINAIAPPGSGSVIDALSKQFKATGGAKGVGDITGQVEGVRQQAKAAADAASKMQTADLSAEQLQATMASLPQIDITKPIDDLRYDIERAEKDLRRLNAEIENMFVKGGGGSGGTGVSNSRFNDYVDKIARAQGDEAANIVKATGKVPSMGAMNAQFANDTTPVEEFEVNAKRNSVNDKRRLSAQEQLAVLTKEEQAIIQAIGITQTEKAIVDREIAATQKEIGALAQNDQNIGQHQYLASVLTTYQQESAQFAAQEAKQIAELTRKKQEIAAQAQKQVAKETKPVDERKANAVTVTDKSADNAVKLVGELGKAAQAMEAIANWSGKELSNLQDSVAVEKEKARAKREEAVATEKLIQLERTEGERQRLELQQSAAIITAEQNRTSLVQARLEFEKLVTAEVLKQVEQYKNLKTPNAKGAGAIQGAAALQGAQPSGDPNQIAATQVAGQTAAITGALQAQTAAVQQQAATGGTAQASALQAAYAQVAASAQAAPVVQAINTLTTNMATALQNQSQTVANQAQGVAQSLDQILERKNDMDKIMSGNLIFSRLQKAVDFDEGKVFASERMAQQVSAIKGQFQDLANMTKGAKDQMKAELAQRTSDLSSAYQKELALLTQHNSDVRAAYLQESGELRKQIDARKELQKQQSDPTAKLQTSGEITALQERLKALDDVFAREVERVRRHKETLAAEFNQLNDVLKRQGTALNQPGQSDPNAASKASQQQADQYKKSLEEMDAARKKELDDTRRNTAAQKSELDKKVTQMRDAIGQESNLSQKALDQKRQALQTELNILQQANQQRAAALQQEKSDLQRARTAQIGPMQKKISELKAIAEMQIGVEREETNQTIAELTRRVAAVRALYQQQISAANQSIAGLRQAYAQEVAPLQQQANVLQNAMPKPTMYQNLLNVGKGFASVYAIIAGSRQAIQAAVQLEQYVTQLKRAKVATIELSGSVSKAESAINAIKSASGGTITSLTAMQIANQAMALGLADSSAEFERLTLAARGVSLVSPVIHDVQSAITELALASANMSFRRLDQLGLSVTEVKDRIEELQKANGNLSDNQAFYEASVDRLITKYGDLVTSQEAAATGMERLRVAWKDLASSSGLIGQFVNVVTEGTNLTASQMADFLNWIDFQTGNKSADATQKLITDLINDKKIQKASPVNPTASMGNNWGGLQPSGPIADANAYESEDLVKRAEEEIKVLEKLQAVAAEVQQMVDDNVPGAERFKKRIDEQIANAIGDGTVDLSTEYFPIVNAIRTYKVRLAEALNDPENIEQRRGPFFEEYRQEMLAQVEDAKLFAEELQNVSTAVQEFNKIGLTAQAEELQGLQLKKMEEGDELSDDDEARMEDLIAASTKAADIMSFTAEMSQNLGAEFANTDKTALNLRDSVIALNAALSSGRIDELQYDLAFKQAQESLKQLTEQRNASFTSTLTQLDAAMKALENRPGESGYIAGLREQLAEYRRELLLTGGLSVEDQTAALGTANQANNIGAAPIADGISTDDEFAAHSEEYASLIALTYELKAAREAHIITEEQYQQALASTAEQMSAMQSEATAVSTEAFGELATAILNLDAVSTGGIAGFDALAEQAVNLQIAMSETGFATEEQARQAEYYSTIANLAAESTGFYGQAVGVLGEQFLANNPAIAATIQHLIELQAAEMTGAISTEVFAGQASVLTGELVVLGGQAGLTAAQIQSAFGNAMAMVAGLKAQFGGSAGFLRGARIGTGLVAADRRVEGQRQREIQADQAKEAKKAADKADKAGVAAAKRTEAAFDKAAKATEKVWEEAAKTFESELKKIAGVFDTTKVTEEDMNASKAGAYKDKPDEFLRRLRDEVLNNKDWQDVSIEKARDALAKAGLDASGDDKKVLSNFEQAWEDSSLFSAEENLALFNKGAVEFQKGLQEKMKKGEENILKYFGESIETATGTYVITPGTKDEVQAKVDEAVAEVMKDLAESNAGGGGGGGDLGSDIAGSIENGIMTQVAKFADTTWMNGAISDVSMEEAKAALQRIGVDIANKTEEEILLLFDNAVANGTLFSADENLGLVDKNVIAKQQEIQAQGEAGLQKINNYLNNAAAMTVQQWNASIDTLFAERASAIQGPALPPGLTDVKQTAAGTTGNLEVVASVKMPEEAIEVVATIKTLTVAPEALTALKTTLGELSVTVGIADTAKEALNTELTTLISDSASTFPSVGLPVSILSASKEGIIRTLKAVLVEIQPQYPTIGLPVSVPSLSGDGLITILNSVLTDIAPRLPIIGLTVSIPSLSGDGLITTLGSMLEESSPKFPIVGLKVSVDSAIDMPALVKGISGQITEWEESFKAQGRGIAALMADGFIGYDYTANKKETGKAFIDGVGQQLQLYQDRIIGQGEDVAAMMAGAFAGYFAAKPAVEGEQPDKSGIADGAPNLFSLEMIDEKNKVTSAQMLENLKSQFTNGDSIALLMTTGDSIMGSMHSGMSAHDFSGIADDIVADLQAAFGNEKFFNQLFNLGGAAMDAILSGAATRIENSSIGAVVVNGITEKVMKSVTETMSTP